MNCYQSQPTATMGLEALGAGAPIAGAGAGAVALVTNVLRVLLPSAEDSSTLNKVNTYE